MEGVERNGSNDKYPQSNSLKFNVSKVMRKNFKVMEPVNEIAKPPFINDKRVYNINMHEEKSKEVSKEIKNDFSKSSPLQKAIKCSSNGEDSFEKSLNLVQSSVGPVELRRTSRRIVHRVKKDFVIDFLSIKKQTRPKTTIPGYPEKKKGNIPRRPGRPRKNPDIKLSKLDVIKLPSKNTSEQVPINTVPTAFSPQFQSYLQTSYYPKPNYTEIQNFSFREHEPLIYPSHKNDELSFKTSKLPSAIHQDFNVNPQATSSKPTVVYFKLPKSYTKDPASGLQKSEYRIREDNLNFQSFSCGQYQERADKIYLQEKYRIIDKAIVDYFYGISQGNIQRSDLLLKRYISRELKLLPSDIVYPFSTSQFLVENTEDIRYQWNAPIQRVLSETASPSFNDVDTLNRQVIVDSIRILYDEESVL